MGDVHVDGEITLKYVFKYWDGEGANKAFVSQAKLLSVHQQVFYFTGPCDL